MSTGGAAHLFKVAALSFPEQRNPLLANGNACCPANEQKTAKTADHLVP